jgi:hypothetical protein
LGNTPIISDGKFYNIHSFFLVAGNWCYVQLHKTPVFLYVCFTYPTPIAGFRGFLFDNKRL